MKLAARMNDLGTENAFEVLAEIEKLRLKGEDIVSFAIGEPDFDTPENIKRAGMQAISENHTHYGPSAGLLELRKNIAAYINVTRNTDYGPQNVVVTPGAKPIIFYTILSLIDPGDEVIYPSPGFPIYESVVRFVGGVPVPIALREEREFSFDVSELAALVSDKTKLIIINSPQNPTGGVLSAADLQAVAAIAKERGIWVLSDEIYSRILYEGEFQSIASIPGMKERTVILEGFSKTYAMTGWRLGYGLAPEELIVQLARLMTNSNSCTATFSQLAGSEALIGSQESVAKMVREFQERRDLIVDGLNDIEGITCLRPKGAFYVYPNVTGACKKLGFATGKELQNYLLYEGKAAVLPQTAFGKRNAGETREYIRLSFATSQETIKEGLRRIKKAIER